MTDARQAWSDAGHQISQLTAKLKESFEQQRAAEARHAESEAGPAPAETPGPEPAAPGGTATSSTTSSGSPTGGGAARAELQEAMRRLSDAARDVFEVLSGAAKDPSVKADVKHVGNTVSTAFAATFGDIAEQVRKASSKAHERSESSTESAPSGSAGAADSSAKAAEEVPSGGTPPTEAPPADAPPAPPYGTPPSTPTGD